MDELLQKALDAGFTYAVPLNVATLELKTEVRDMCAADKCHAYGKNWTCPPQCGTLGECEARIRRYQKGILVQTVGKIESSLDWDEMMELEQSHKEHFHAFADTLRQLYPDVLCLGTGGCRICGKCAYPEPCRFPEKACSSMEGYGLLVSDVCKQNDLPYYHGAGTMAYTCCYLFSEERV